MPRQLYNASITHVSYVDKAANKQKFFLTKSADKQAPTFDKDVKAIVKADDEQKLVYGVVYEPGVEDTHGDFMEAADIEKAAHGFMKSYQNIDTQHNFEAGAGELVESYVAPADFQVGEATIAKGSWVIVTKATEEIWKSIKEGEITGYSMAGVAETKEIAKSDEVPLFERFKKFLKGESVQKGEVTDRFNATQKYRDLYAARNIFDDVFYDEVWNEKPDSQRLADAANDLANLFNQIASSPDSFIKAMKEEDKEKYIAKAGRKISSERLSKLQTAYETLGTVLTDVQVFEAEQEEEIDVKKEDLQEVIKEALTPINEKLEALEKADKDIETKQEETVEKAEAALTKEEMTQLLKEAMAPISERLETVEKARGIKKSAEQEEDEKEEVTKSSGGVFGSLFGHQ